MLASLRNTKEMARHHLQSISFCDILILRYAARFSFRQIELHLRSDVRRLYLRGKAREIGRIDFCAFFRRFFYSKEVIAMETRVALIGIVVEEAVSIEKMNALLHQYGAYIIGRMGVPYPKRGINIISVAMDAPGDVISALSGKLGMLPGISTKTIYSKISSTPEDNAL